MASEVRQYTNIACLALLVYDLILTWDRELNCVWRSSDWALKTMFFLGRYGAIAAQTINLVITHPSILEKQMIGCYKWFGFQITALCLLLLNLQLVLMLRVYALYERSIKIGIFLICWFLFYITIMVLSGRTFIDVLELDSRCMMVKRTASMATVPFSVVCMLDQCILWGLTTNKYRSAIRRGWSTNPIIRLVMRDTSWSSLAICCVFIATIPYALRPVTIAHVIFSLFYSLLSMVACRTILNMRSLWNPDAPSTDVGSGVDVELTDLDQLE